MDPYWTPSAEDLESSQISRFRQFANARYGLALKDYWDLWKWSVGSSEDINNFWVAVWDFTGIIGEKGTAPLFNATLPMHETHRFFTPTTRVNWAENILLGHPMARRKDRVAIYACNEANPAIQSRSARIADMLIRTLTWDELYLEVARAHGGLIELGVKEGDRVAAITSNNAEAIILLLATSSLGAIWSSVSPELGAASILDRFDQLKPKVVLSVDKYRAAGRVIDITSNLKALIPKLDNVETVIMVGQLNKNRHCNVLPSFKGVKVLQWTELVSKRADSVTFWRGPANAPLWVLFSSGTTGKPKAIIHSQLGMILAIKTAAPLHGDLRVGEVQLQLSTWSWMMANHMTNHLSCGISLVLYDGSFLFPRQDTMFDLVEAFKVTSFSLSPRYLQLLAQAGMKPNITHDLTSLKSIYSAGSPLTEDMYAYIKDSIKYLFINNGSGGTDVCAGLVGSCPTLPIYPGLIQVPFLGCAIAAYNDDGEDVKVGEGELVITKPLPMMPLGFLGDPDRSRLRDTYFNQYPGKTTWYHADHIAIDERGSIKMLGRSDGVLNPQGVRFGSAELYAILDTMKEEIDDCIAVGQKIAGDERVVLFVKPANNRPLSNELIAKIRHAITTNLSRRHVPSVFIECSDIPYTTNGKRVEVAVKKLINGQPIEKINSSGMANPDSLKFFINHPELRLPRPKL